MAQGGRGDRIAGRLTFRELDFVAPSIFIPASITPAPIVTPNSETPETLEPSSLQIPVASDLLREYVRFRDVRGKPCGGGISNQCAVRMSVALMRCDIGFFFDRTVIAYTHSATSSRCGTGAEHNASASRLFNYLKTLWTFHKYSKVGNERMSADQILTAVTPRSGIIYFENCFTRGGSDRKVGDHIDYWDGKYVMNDRLNYNGPGERKSGDVRRSRWFRNSQRNIWFLPITEG